MILGNVLFNTRLTGAISIARPFSSTAVLLLFAGGGAAMRHRRALP